MRWPRLMWAAVGLCLLGVITLQTGHGHGAECSTVETACWLCQLPAVTVPTIPETVTLSEPTLTLCSASDKLPAAPLQDVPSCTFTVRAPPQ